VSAAERAADLNSISSGALRPPPARPVRLVDDLLHLRRVHPQALDRELHAPRLRGDDVYVQRVGSLCQHGLSAPAHQDNPAVRCGLRDHPLGQLDERRLIRLDARHSGGRDEQLGGSGGQGVREPLQQPRSALVALRHRVGGEARPARDFVHELVVDDVPPELRRHEARDLRTAGGILPGDRDDRRRHLRASGSYAAR
jgi:hypothetical protein